MAPEADRLLRAVCEDGGTQLLQYGQTDAANDSSNAKLIKWHLERQAQPEN